VGYPYGWRGDKENLFIQQCELYVKNSDTKTTGHYLNQKIVSVSLLSDLKGQERELVFWPIQTHLEQR
jgi:hypothetical protein